MCESCVVGVVFGVGGDEFCGCYNVLFGGMVGIVIVVGNVG